MNKRHHYRIFIPGGPSMIYGYDEVEPSMFYDSTGNLWLIDDFGHWLPNPFKDPAVRMDSTGIEDKASVLIFESDVIRFDNGDTGIIKSEEWSEFYVDPIGEWECEDQVRDFYRIGNARVIGNIYQHPELLN